MAAEKTAETETKITKQKSTKTGTTKHKTTTKKKRTLKRTLLVVESPAKAKTIEKYLGRKYMVRASMGHLRDLPKSQFGIDVEHDFTPKYINIRGKGDLIKALKKDAKAADQIYLASDPDREGEAIAWHLAYILGIEAVKHPRSINMDQVDAQQARRMLDRIVGYKLSPLLWRKVRKGLSAGRVQSVAVKLICDREKEIQAFESVEYWTVGLKLRKAKSAMFPAELTRAGRWREDRSAYEAGDGKRRGGAHAAAATGRSREENGASPQAIGAVYHELHAAGCRAQARLHLSPHDDVRPTAL